MTASVLSWMSLFLVLFRICAISMWMVSCGDVKSHPDNQLTPKSMVALKKAFEGKHCDSLQAVSLNRTCFAPSSPSERLGRGRCEVARRDHRGLSAALAEAEPQRWRCFLSLTPENHIGDAGMKPLLDELEKKGSSLNELSLSRWLFPVSPHRKRLVAVLAGPHRSAARRGNAFQPARPRPLLCRLLSLLTPDNYSEDMLKSILSGFGSGHCRSLRRLVISGMCLEADGCNQLRDVLKEKALPGLQELVMAGERD